MKIFAKMAMIAALIMPMNVVMADEKADKIVESFEGWLKKLKIKHGSIAVSFNGELVAQGGKAREISDIAGVASLSKAITAACVTHALKDNGKNLSDPLSVLIPKFLKTQAKPRDKRFVTMTAKQLMVQNSGMKTDISQKQLRRLKSMKYENSDWQFKTQAKIKLVQNPGGKHIYNNMNYMLLGLVIDEVTGEAHEDYCKRVIFEPLGIVTARIDPEWRAISAYAGWQISAEDYLKFANWAFGNNQILGKNPVYSSPNVEYKRNRFYGSGVYFGQTATGYDFWHGGRWGGHRKKRANFGAYFVVYANGFSVSMNYSKFLSVKQSAAFGDMIYKVSH